uniref:Uncharacterized protein n=1 Tax=Chlamydomonas euryale TaxID=1486919 RepID=A0A7R9VZZ5_9CHLO|mmetsp:Transcript_8380/g.25307  ORF Transcript_8380/g.25307 Transcript_8380/m.25307 type:complete len:118 (+) Transcript_8380:152-505(+)
MAYSEAGCLDWEMLVAEGAAADRAAAVDAAAAAAGPPRADRLVALRRALSERNGVHDGVVLSKSISLKDGAAVACKHWAEHVGLRLHHAFLDPRIRTRTWGFVRSARRASSSTRRSA